MDKCIKLVKNGKFYNAYNDDGIVLANVMNYKYDTYRCSSGFPKEVLVRVCNRLEHYKISYEVCDGNVVVDKYKGIDKCYDQLLKTNVKN